MPDEVCPIHIFFEIFFNKLKTIHILCPIHMTNCPNCHYMCEIKCNVDDKISINSINYFQSNKSQKYFKSEFSLTHTSSQLRVLLLYTILRQKKSSIIYSAVSLCSLQFTCSPMTCNKCTCSSFTPPAAPTATDIAHFLLSILVLYNWERHPD